MTHALYFVTVWIFFLRNNIPFTFTLEKLTFEDVRSPQEFRKGEDAEVVCHVNSSPAPMVRWLNNGEEVTDIDDS